MQASLKKPQGRLKHIQSEHFSKLLSKQNSETELLEDMRSFCKQRAILEKEYGQSLQKLCSSFLSKKEFLALRNPPDVVHRSVWDVWKSFLRQCSDLALSHLKSAEVHHRLSLDLKPVKSVRISVSKRMFDQLKFLQNDLAASMQEMVKSQKIYSEEEKQAHETRLKAMHIEERLRRRSTNLFSTMAQLHRNHAKLSLRREECENRSAGARNEYIFQLTAINAHLVHYLKTDIPDLAQVLDGDVYDRFREVLSKTSETELEICRHHHDPFKALLEESTKINRSTAWEQFIKESPVFSEDVEFQFEPREGDMISTLLSVNATEGSFEQVAKKLARRFVMRERRIKSYREEISDLCSGRISPSPGMSVPLSQQSQPRKFSLKDYDAGEVVGAFNQEYVENKVEELEFAIRREEIEKAKVKACLDLLKKTHVNVQAALDEAYLAAAAEAATLTSEKPQNVASSGSTTGPLSSSTAATGSSSAEGSTVGVLAMSDLSQRRNSLLGDPFAGPASSENQTQDCIRRISAHQTANEAWARATDYEHSFIQLDDEDSSSRKQPRDPSPEVDWSGGGRLPKATAMYEFLASRDDEVNLVCNEKVVLLGTGDGEDWVKVRSLLDGKEGLVPRAFLSIDPTPPLAPPHPTTVSALTATTSTEHEPSLPPPPASITSGRVSEASAPPTAAVSSHPPMSQCMAGQFVRALIDFEGTADDELSFRVGDVIHVLGRPATGEVDDGWIEGEVVPTSSNIDGTDNRIARGVFPSMLVEAVEAEESWRSRVGASRRTRKSVSRSKSRPVSAKRTVGGVQKRSVSGHSALSNQRLSHHVHRRTAADHPRLSCSPSATKISAQESPQVHLEREQTPSLERNGANPRVFHSNVEVDSEQLQIAEL
uniref:F-BAR domain-containing protein n=2 Tax=Mesocestoides corti TaxID=53468 RepID=A0A5K3ETF3_MESCO